MLYVLCFVVVLGCRVSVSLSLSLCVCVCVAYREGVVVTTCKGCDSKHLIADNLSTDNGSLGGGTNIEDYFKINGGSNTKNYCDTNNESDNAVVSEINSDIPMAPPSIKLLGNKKPFSPKPAEKILNKIKKPSCALCHILTRSNFASLANSLFVLISLSFLNFRFASAILILCHIDFIKCDFYAVIPFK